MQKIKILIISFIVFSCNSKSDIKNKEAMSSLKVIIADNSLSLENVRDEILVLKGEIEKYSHSDKALYDDVLEKMNLINSSLLSTQQKLDLEINQMKIEFNKAIEEIKKNLVPAKENNEDISKLDIDTRYKKAVAYYKEKNYDQALVFFKTMIGSKSKWYDERARFNYCSILFELKRYEEAIVEFQELINKFPKSNFIPNALTMQAKSFIKLNMKKEASASYSELVNKYPKSIEAQKAREYLNKNK